MASNATNARTSIKIFVKNPSERVSLEQITSMLRTMGLKTSIGRPFYGLSDEGEFTTAKGCVAVLDGRKQTSLIAFSDFVENISRKSTNGFRVEHSGMVFFIVPDISTGIQWKLPPTYKSSKSSSEDSSKDHAKDQAEDHAEDHVEEPEKVFKSVPKNKSSNISFGKHPVKLFVCLSHLRGKDIPSIDEITDVIEYNDSRLIFKRSESRNGDITFDVNKKLGFEPGSPEWLDFAPIVQGFVESIKHARNGVRDKSRLFKLFKNVWVDFMFINTIQPWMNHFLKVKRDIQDVEQNGNVVWKTIYVNPEEQLQTPPPHPQETPKKTWNFPALPSKTFKVNGKSYKSESEARSVCDALNEAGFPCSVECVDE